LTEFAPELAAKNGIEMEDDIENDTHEGGLDDASELRPCSGSRIFTCSTCFTDSLYSQALNLYTGP